MGDKCSSEMQKGIVNVVITYVVWGMLTIFWKLLADVNSVYVLFQRIIWSMLFMLGYLVIRGRIGDIINTLKDRGLVLTCLMNGMVICVNWGVFIYAVNSGHVLDSSLGYFIEPIFATVIGISFFKEKLSILEKLTIVFAVIGIAYQIFTHRTFPLLAIIIGLSFAYYGAVKKSVHLDAEMSLFMETLMMTPVALIVCIVLELKGVGAIGTFRGLQWLLFPAAGVVTSVPLLYFSRGVKQLPYYLTGILMYINPSISFLLGVFYFGETVDRNRLISFVFIWIGVALTIYQNVRALQRVTSSN